MRTSDNLINTLTTPRRGRPRKNRDAARRDPRWDLYAASAILGMCANPSDADTPPQMIVSMAMAIADMLAEARDR